MIREHRVALLIMALHLALGVLYSTMVPLWEAYDEWGHYPYLHYIARQRALPPRDRNIQEFNDTVMAQPPLYYILGAAATFWIDTSDYRPALQNRYSSLPTAMGGYNRALHGRDEDFPWRGWVLSAHVARLVSVLLTTITVGLTYVIGRTLFPDRLEIAYGAAAICAFWPQFLFIGSVINNDNLVGTFVALLLLFMVRSVVGPPRWVDRLGLLVAMTGAVAAKLTGAALLPVALMGLAWSFGKSMRLMKGRQLVLTIGLAILALVAVGAVFSMSHSSYIRSLRRFLHPPMSPGDMPLSQWRDVAGVMWGTLWASFGWQSVGIDEWVYKVIEPVWLLALAGLLWFFIRSRQTLVKWALAGLLLSVLLVIAGIGYRGLFNAYYFTGRYLLSTIAAISTLLAVGLGSLGRREWSQYILGTVGVAMGVFALYVPFAYIAPVYARPDMLPAQALERLAQPVFVNFDGKIELAGYEVEPSTFYPGQTVEVSLYWRALQAMSENYTLAVKLLGPDDSELATLNVHPGRGNYPTSLWRKGDIFKDTYLLPVRGDAPPLTMARLKVALFLDRDDLPHLPAQDTQGRDLGFAAMLGRFKVAAENQSKYTPEHPADYHFDDVAALTGFNLPDRVSPAQPLTVTLYWETRSPTDRPYTVFAHVADEQGVTVAQADGQPAGGAFPTDLWGHGEVFSDTHLIPLPSTILTGSYQVLVGLYSVETGRRMPVTDGRGQPVPNNQIELGTLTIGDDG